MGVAGVVLIGLALAVTFTFGHLDQLDDGEFTVPNLPDPVRRALRTFLQAFLLVVVTSTSTDVIPAAGELAEIALGAAWAGALAVLSWAHGKLEESGRIKDRR